MQKDVHFYLTYALSRKIGIPHDVSERIAWANQFTDDLTEADLHGVQTQSAILGNWHERQIQLSVLVPFHFIPGSDPEHPWITTRNSGRARKLVNLASRDQTHLHLGIALHGLQDTFSHEGFSGWQEDINSCYSWYYIESAIPNVGHAEMRVIPDVVNYIWTDPRSGKQIDNRKRTMSAAKATYDFLAKFFNPDIDPIIWENVQIELQQIFKIESYDEVNGMLEGAYKIEFIRAAKHHLSEVMRLCKDLS